MAVYAFGPFILDPAERWLMRDGRRLSVPGKAWQILLILAEAGGRLVSHEAFRAKLWPNVAVEDRTLTVHMSTLRKALGDGADVIQTVSREGYRLAVPAHLVSHEMPAAGNWREPKPLAVRSFATTGMAGGDAYLGVGIADAVTTTLGAVPGLAVASAGAVDDLDGAHDAVEVCRTRGIGHLLEGSVERRADRVQVSARLIDVASGLPRWSERFEHPIADSVALQDAIAKRVAGSLAQASAAESARFSSYRPRSSEAYLLQLEARANLRQYMRLPALRAMGLFERALALDPDYDMAHAGLASTYMALASNVIKRPLPVEEAMPLARASAERALALDEGLAEAWAVLGRVKMEYDWDWDGAEADLAHAVALNPSSVEALDAYGQFLSAMGRHDEALETMEHAQRLDPRRLETLWHFGLCLWMADQSERALEVMGASLKVPPHATRGHMGRMVIFDHLGRHDEAMGERLTWLRRQVPPQGDLADRLEEVHRSRGWCAVMPEWLAALERSSMWMTVCMQATAAGEHAKALDVLERCVNDRATYLAFLLQHPSFRVLHREPRFRGLVNRLGLDRSARMAAH